jgi:hypothetical protein
MSKDETVIPDLQGAPVRPYGAAEPLRHTSYQLRILLGVQIVLSLTVLSIALNLIATLPDGATSPQSISLLVFVNIFSILSWLYIFFIANHVPDKWYPKLSSIALGTIGFIFYVTSSLVLTVAITPATGCDNQDYLNNNKLIAGGGATRCRLVTADVALVWISIFPFPKFSDVSFCALFLGGNLEIEEVLDKEGGCDVCR